MQRMGCVRIARMKVHPALTGLLLLILASACGSASPTVNSTVAPAVSPTLPPPGEQIFQAPDVEITAQAFLDAWKTEDYASMYGMLTPLSQDAIREEDFTARYQDIVVEAAIDNIDAHILSSLTQTQHAQVSYRVILHSVLVGDIQRDTVMNLTLEGNDWRIGWEDNMILPELAGGNRFRMEYRVPSRANIYDQGGKALVAQADAVAIGLRADEVKPKEEDDLLDELWQLTGERPENLKPKLQEYRKNDWYLAVGDVSADEMAPKVDALSQYDGVVLEPFRSRYYFDGGIAPHVVGYVSVIQEDEIEKYKRLGYNVWSDRVGRMGLEQWGEQYLSGKRGGTLYVVDPEGKTVTKMPEETNPEPAQAIYTTLDRSLQIEVQKALGDFLGAVVVLERDTGRVLALASSPGFNPNLFEPTNYNRASQIDSIFDPATTPWLNRATQGLYPLGSVFKIVTMSAALDSGLYTPESEYQCGYFFEEIPGFRSHDWTYTHFQESGSTPPSGLLTLPEGLMRSCNPFFQHIGYDFYTREMTSTIASIAEGFGLSQLTGIEIVEETGNIPEPENEVDSANLAIGQGNTLVTPLQVADFIAAVGNGGTLYTPQVVEKIVPVSGEPSEVFTPTVRGKLPISEKNLKVLEDAMSSVVMNPRGTAYFVLSGFSNSYNIPIAGKTGTAESGFGLPHAWFAGYTSANRENKPDIAVVVLVENIGEGSEYAAPIFRRVLETYFLGKPQVKYPWETEIGVVATPEPEEEDSNGDNNQP
jgi:cell division protein FtsI/penicillin-binding protein 2